MDVAHLDSDVEWLFKIVSAAEWAEVSTEAAWAGTALDRKDGFIHLSAAAQVQGTLEKHYSGQAGLLLLWVRAAALPKLRWAPSRGGALFPHLYAPLQRAWVGRESSLDLGAAGRHVLPDGL